MVRSVLRSWMASGLMAALAALSAAAVAQQVPPGTPTQRSPLERLPEPALPRPVPSPALELPRVAPPTDAGRLSSALRVRVTRFRIVGNTVFPETELLALLAPYTGREIGTEELEEARLRITAHYIARG